jgi:spermidine synthase
MSLAGAVQPYVPIARAKTPDGDDLELMRRGDEFTIRVCGRELMASRVHGSEAALARLSLERLSNRERSRVVVAGLGMGYTLRAALDLLGPHAVVVVSELMAAVVEWNRTLLAELAGRPLDDARVRVEVGDVSELVRGARVSFDSVLLDVDNGPEALARVKNAWLYSLAGLRAIRGVLSRNGVLGVWSAAPDPSFFERLLAAGYEVTEHHVHARSERRGRRHVIWVAVHR